MGSNDNSLFVGFDFFAKQVEEDPQNPSADALGLTSGSPRTPTTTNISHNVPDPTSRIGELPPRQHRIDEMQARMAEGTEPFSGESARDVETHSHESGEMTDAQLLRLFTTHPAYGMTPDQARDEIEELKRQSARHVPQKVLSIENIRANEAAEQGIETGDYWADLQTEAERYSDDDDFHHQEDGEVATPPTASPNGGAFGKSHDEMMIALSQAIGFMEKQQINPRTDVNAIAEVEDSWGGDPNVFTEDPEAGEGTAPNAAQQNWLDSQDNEAEAEAEAADSNDITSQAVPRNVLEKLPETNSNEFNDPDTEEYGLGLNTAQQNWLAETEKRDEELDTPRKLPQSGDSENLSGDGFIKALGALIDGMESR